MSEIKSEFLDRETLKFNSIEEDDISPAPELEDFLSSPIYTLQKIPKPPRTGL